MAEQTVQVSVMASPLTGTRATRIQVDMADGREWAVIEADETSGLLALLRACAILEVTREKWATPDFADSQGDVREYPERLPVEDRDEYQAWVERQIAANADNHKQPITLASAIDYDGIAAKRVTTGQ